jgi:uncharacterized integral membrane protein
MRIFVWLFWALLFFSLFAFALNNQQVVSLNWFFGVAWTAPLVIIVLLVFVCGIALGVFAMTPSWWRQRQLAKRHANALPTAVAESPASAAPNPAKASVIDGV